MALQCCYCAMLSVRCNSCLCRAVGTSLRILHVSLWQWCCGWPFVAHCGWVGPLLLLTVWWCGCSIAWHAGREEESQQLRSCNAAECTVAAQRRAIDAACVCAPVLSGQAVDVTLLSLPPAQTLRMLLQRRRARHARVIQLRFNLLLLLRHVPRLHSTPSYMIYSTTHQTAAHGCTRLRH
ncbi:hypothetical protein COO60DRAFT_72651 [Scenedesmus sp. NREL 46B-D3]|nr:hypothetical protein COO60DRAFT_72651 [Scenedesmus sp. NREL 46B-D3]